MKSFAASLKLQLTVFVVILLATVWCSALYDLDRTQRTLQSEAEFRTVAQAQVFSEYSRATIKRIDELILTSRSLWTGDLKLFADAAKLRQESINDIAFQLAVIDKNGLLPD